MTNVGRIVDCLQAWASPELAETWDNVGLLIGDGGASVERLMTCLTLTEDVADEALRENAQFIVTHHPVLFRPVQKLTSEDAQGRMLLALIAGKVAVFSPHTSYDSAVQGINQQLGQAIGLAGIEPMQPALNVAGGTGRVGNLPAAQSLQAFMEGVKASLNVSSLQYVGDPGKLIRRVGIACGSGGEMLGLAIAQQCDVLLTGEARFHTLLEARARNVSLVLAGHYATERPGMEQLAAMLRQAFPQMTIWPSREERDPLCWF